MHLALRDRLAYPTGVAPGIDQQHPASKNIRFSGIPNSGTMIDLLSGQLGAPQSSNVNTAITGRGGPVVSTFLNGVTSNANINFPGRSTALDSEMTSAAIFLNDPSGNETSWFSNSSGTGSTWFGYVGGGALAQAGANYDIRGAMSAGKMYFAAISLSAAAFNWVIKDMETGQVTSGTAGGFIPVAGDGNYKVGVRSNAIGSRISASMMSACLLSPRQLLEWSEDPWAFWYPRRAPDFLVGSVATGFKAAWARNSNILYAPGALMA